MLTMRPQLRCFMPADELLGDQEAAVEIESESTRRQSSNVYVVEGALRIDAGAVDQDVAAAKFFLE